MKHDVDREAIANQLADEGWSPDSVTEYLGDRYIVTKWMTISDEAIDAHLAEQRACQQEDMRDRQRDDDMERKWEAMQCNS